MKPVSVFYSQEKRRRFKWGGMVVKVGLGEPGGEPETDLADGSS